MNMLNKFITPDFHLFLLRVEPLLHADFIKYFLENHKFKSLLETNGSLPDELRKLVGLVDYVSMDIKLPEHNASKNSG